MLRYGRMFLLLFKPSCVLQSLVRLICVSFDPSSRIHDGISCMFPSMIYHHDILLQQLNKPLETGWLSPVSHGACSSKDLFQYFSLWFHDLRGDL